MGTTFRPCHPDQVLLLPQDLREWVPEGHLAHHCERSGGRAGSEPVPRAPYEGDGRRDSPYDPRMMVKVPVYGTRLKLELPRFEGHFHWDEPTRSTPSH